MDHSNSKFFTDKETREMHRFFFEKEDRQPYNPTASFEEPALELVIEELIKSKLPLKRNNRRSSNIMERELLNPYISQNKRARVTDPNF